MKRRGRAKIGTLLAVLLILVPLPMGAYAYTNLMGLSDQEIVYTMNGQLDDSVFDSSKIQVNNETGEVVYQRSISENYTTDVRAVNYGYRNLSGDYFRLPLSRTELDSGVFVILEQSEEDPSSDLEFGSPEGGGYCPTIGYVLPVSPKEMLDAGVSDVELYFENAQEMNLTVVLGVAEGGDWDPTTEGTTQINAGGVYGDLGGNSQIECKQDLVSVVDGSWMRIEVSPTRLLTEATLHSDGYVFLAVIDADGGVLEETNGILVSVRMYGNPETPVSMDGIWKGCLVATGLLSILGAIIATPYISIEGLMGDGLGGQRYKQGYNPRKDRRR